ncbi:hypothetical protein DSECCO2_596840 [anaerobic digester metagenome]
MINSLISLKKEKKGLNGLVYFFFGVSIPPSMASMASMRLVVGVPVFCIVMVLLAAFAVVGFVVGLLLSLLFGASMLMLNGFIVSVFLLRVCESIVGMMVYFPLVNACSVRYR